MTDSFIEMLTVGGHTNSLGEVSRVIDSVLRDKSRLEELYSCLFADDAWMRMRAADALEKICREHPDWLLSYVDRLMADFSSSPQPSIQWHLAQIYAEVALTPAQKQRAMQWMQDLLETTDVDWIASANAMKTLVQFTQEGSFPVAELRQLLVIQQKHHAKSVVRHATKFLEQLD